MNFINEEHAEYLNENFNVTNEYANEITIDDCYTVISRDSNSYDIFCELDLTLMAEYITFEQVLHFLRY